MIAYYLQFKMPLVDGSAKVVLHCWLFYGFVIMTVEVKLLGN